MRACERCGSEVAPWAQRRVVAGKKLGPCCLDATASLQALAHDSGDGETIYHCPFCGGGAVVARSDMTVECGFCNTVFTVQVQPRHPFTPQTINGKPYDNPEMPGEVAEPGSVQPTQPPPGEQPPPGQESLTFTPPGGEEVFDPTKVRAAAAKVEPGYFITASGDVLDREAFMRHLAIRFAEDKDAVLAQVRAENGS